MRTLPLFVVAGVLLVCSAALDQIFPQAYLGEDSVKLFGIATWSAALLFTCADLLRRDAPEVLPPGDRRAGVT